jgi:AcrR family transcriptional regulator
VPRLSEGANLSEHRAAMEARVLDAWHDLLAEKGYGAVTLADVASRVGIARSAIYRYVPDKVSLLQLLIDREVREFVADVESRMRRVRSPQRRLDLLVTAQLDYFARQQVMAHDMAGALTPQQHQSVATHLAPVRDLVGSVIDEGIASGVFRRMDREVAAELVFAVIGSHQMALARGEADVDRVAKETLTFLRGALGRP